MNALRKYDILNNHNDYELAIPRNNAEEIRNDPFGLGNAFNGLKRVNHQTNLANYAEQLVSDYGKYNYDHCELSLHELPEEEQNELVRLYIESTGRDLTECVNGNDFSIENEYTCALLSMLQNDCKQTHEHFSEVTRKNILTYYKESLEQLLNEACINYLHSINNEQDLYARQDMEHGDIVWGKY